MRVTLLSDYPHFKAAGNNPFISHVNWPTWRAGGAPFTAGNLRKAYRHGGALPWSIFSEFIESNLDAAIYPLPAPASSSYYVMERIQPAVYANQTPDFNVIQTRVGTNGFGRPIFTFAPPALGLNIFATPAPFTDHIVAKLLHPGKPVLPSAEIDVPTQEWRVGSLDSNIATGDGMALIKAAGSALNAMNLGPQSCYFIRVTCNGAFRDPGSYGAPYPEVWPLFYDAGTSKWTADPTGRSGFDYSGSRHMTGNTLNGWLYCIQIDPNTGAITAAYAMPEAGQVTAIVKSQYWQWDLTQSSLVPAACAMTWPLGVRGLSATVFRPGAYPTGTAIGGRATKLLWRPAKPWQYGAMIGNDPTSGAAGYQWANTNWTGFPFSYPYFGNQSTFNLGPVFPYRSMYFNDTGWQDLATFPTITGTNVAPGVLAGTQPSPGQEILITGQSGWQYGSTFPASEYPLQFTLVPDASVSPIAIPVAMGGVLQGGAP